MALDNFRSQKIIWDRANKQIFEKIETNSGDSNGRKLVVQIINQETTEVLSGTTLSLGWKSRNGAKGLDAFNAVDASKGIFEIYYTTEMLSNIGNIEASLILINSTGRIESSTFTISVRPSTVDDESIESENSFTALTEALIDVSNLEQNYAPRLNEVTAQLAQITQQLEDGTAGIDDTVVSTDKVWSSARTKEELANIVDGSPKGGFATKTDLQNTFPTGTAGVYVVVEDNNWYYWNGTTWTAGGSYLNGGYYTFTETSQTVNVFDKTKATDGGYYSDTSPYNWISNATIGQSKFIPANPGDVVTINPSTTSNYIFVFKNSEDAIFASAKKTDGKIQNYSVTVPTNAVSVSAAFYLSEKDTFMITINNEMPTEYVSYSGATIKAIEPTFKNAVSDLLGTVSEKGNYDGKYLSILGDSISTFSGWIPSGNAVFYSGSNYGVTSVDQTWWKRLMNQTGMELCVNNSWSGSRVTTTNGTDSAGCMTRATSLHTTTKNPDVIIVYLGINDFNNEVTLGAYDGTTAFPTNTTTFKEAYAIMLSKILTQYKNAEVYVCTLPDCERNGVITFPEINDSGVLLVEWNNAIRELAGLFNLPILEMDKSGLTFYNKDVYLSDNLHPNSSGHKLLANKAIKTIDPAAKFSTVA